MARHCVSVTLADGTKVNLQFGHMPTEDEIKKASEGLERDVAMLKSGELPVDEPKYPD